eukprot:jgi/Mesen1/3652/ME000200S02724
MMKEQKERLRPLLASSEGLRTGVEAAAVQQDVPLVDPPPWALHPAPACRSPCGVVRSEEAAGSREAQELTPGTDHNDPNAPPRPLLDLKDAAFEDPIREGAAKAGVPDPRHHAQWGPLRNGPCSCDTSWDPCTQRHYVHPPGGGAGAIE